jgi:hypothetical protein
MVLAEAVEERKRSGYLLEEIETSFAERTVSCRRTVE